MKIFNTFIDFLMTMEMKTGKVPVSIVIPLTVYNQLLCELDSQEAYENKIPYPRSVNHGFQVHNTWIYPEERNESNES